MQRNSTRLVAVRSRLGAAPPTVQTTSVTNADNGVSWARWPRYSVTRATPGRSSPLRPLRTQGWMGGFAALEASLRRVAGVSRP